MTHNIKRALLIPTAAIMATAMGLVSCNKETSDEYDEALATSVAVTNFQLKADRLVLANLDSVFFSIDLRNQVIFNPDSLPKGTKVEALIPLITYPDEVSEATITVTGGTHLGDKTIDYKANPNDSVDFTGDVVLTLVAGDGVTKRDYRLKVNVHKCDPDSLVWDRVAVSKLPSRDASPRGQKSVSRDNTVYTMIEEHDGTHVLAITDDIYEETWSKKEIILPEGAVLRSFTATSDAFYMLLEDGRLMTSDNARIWLPTGKTWVSITGAYGDAVIGIESTRKGYRHCHYPDTAAITDSYVEQDFPLSGHSNLVSTSTPWASGPTAILTGGIMADGTYSNAVWGFDGNTWAKLGGNALPALEGCTLIPYYSYRKTTTSWIQSEFKVWIVLGGRDSEGKISRDLYISYDNGVNWKKGDTLLSLPDYIPALWNLDSVVITTPMEYNLQDGWALMPERKLPPYYRIAYKVDGYDVEWECPYIYLIGGIQANGYFSDNIWRGVLARLTFAPLF